MNLTDTCYDSLDGKMSPSQGHYLRRTVQTVTIQICIYASSGIRIHDPSVQAGEDILFLTQHSQCGQQ
jgi:hypothetical protein